jgi:hypothetical protein
MADMRHTIGIWMVHRQPMGTFCTSKRDLLPVRSEPNLA